MITSYLQYPYQSQANKRPVQRGVSSFLSISTITSPPPLSGWFLLSWLYLAQSCSGSINNIHC
jgi:hypothetical protein